MAEWQAMKNLATRCLAAFRKRRGRRPQRRVPVSPPSIPDVEGGLAALGRDPARIYFRIQDVYILGLPLAE